MVSPNARFDARAIAILLVLNFVAHFIPFERPGFQQDDYYWLHLARTRPSDYVAYSLSQPIRPLGSALYMLIPSTLGLREGSQLALLVTLTSALTVLIYAYLGGVLGRSLGAFASLIYVLWPVKHEIYSSQLYGTNLSAACLIVASGLFYRTYARDSSRIALGCAALAYGVSILVYELGYFAPLIFLLVEKPTRARVRGSRLFLVPALLYWVLRFSGDATIQTGQAPLALSGISTGLRSLPSNLVGFQLVRNVAYGWWAVWTSPIWFKGMCALSAIAVVLVARSWIASAKRSPERVATRDIVRTGLTTAVLLILPAAAILVESRHSILAAAGMAVAIAGVTRTAPLAGACIASFLVLASQGLALRQAEISNIQASLRHEVVERLPEIRMSDRVIFDISGLKTRVPYTWGDPAVNPFRVYWGMLAVTPGALRYMVEDALFLSGPIHRDPAVTGCAEPVVISNEAVQCKRSLTSLRPFAVPAAGTTIVLTDGIVLPDTIASGGGMR